MKKERNVSIELLRLVCMMMIVFYHFVAKSTEVYTVAWHKALIIPLHVAVVCFVLITGYFGVRLTMRKVVGLLSQIVFYGVVVYSVCHLASGTFSLKGLAHAFMPLSHNPDMWFARTYFLFLLCVPLINKLRLPPPTIHASY